MLKIVTTIARALAVYGTLAFAEMIKNCMSEELSWKVGVNLIIWVGTAVCCSRQSLMDTNWCKCRNLPRNGRHCYWA